MLDHIGQIPARAATEFGNKEALVFEGRSFTFSDLNDLVERAAGGLDSLGIGRGDVVTLYAFNSWEWVVSYFAIARIGAVINPVNTMLMPAEIEYVVQDCGARAIITSADKAAAILGGAEQLERRRYPLLWRGPDGAVSFDALLVADLPPPGPVDIAPEALSTIGYTSGTAGHLKGAMQCTPPGRAALSGAR